MEISVGKTACLRTSRDCLHRSSNRPAIRHGPHREALPALSLFPLLGPPVKLSPVRRKPDGALSATDRTNGVLAGVPNDRR
jgi:hypothetical protein